MTESADVQRILGDHGARLIALESGRVADRTWLATRLDRLEELVRTSDTTQARAQGSRDAKRAMIAAMMVLVGAALGAVELVMHAWRLLTGK